ncbi:MAG: DUF5009 domain-containing protein [Pedobacter sp.]|nr:DUF5009 domain-containing protein [Pedobacter sp.]
MVLSGSIAFGDVMPAWMYHAQVPPPSHIFNPNLAGLTWVDLVFPFFLFAMGAAFPLALHNGNFISVFLKLLIRYVMLVFFAILFNHVKFWNLSAEPGIKQYFLSMAGFALLFLIYSNWQVYLSKIKSLSLKLIGLTIALLFLYLYPFPYGDFSLNKTDIIILVLANMAFFGSLIWYATRNIPMLRLGILPIIMAVFLAKNATDSFNSSIFKWSPLPSVYQFYYLKYLFIVIPGTFAGDWLLSYPKIDFKIIHQKNQLAGIAVINVILIVLNLWGLFSRYLVVNLILNVVLMVLQLFLINQLVNKAQKGFYCKFLSVGIYLLILGLFFEAFEGGIKKDSSTYSYYFVTAGLGFLTLMSFIIAEQLQVVKSALNFFAANGKNPMIAYTAGSLFVLPLLALTDIQHYLNLLNYNWATGFLKGLIFTALVSLITLFFTRIKLFWKT